MPPAGRLLAQHVPGLDRRAQFQCHRTDRNRAEARETELEERVQPGGVEGDPVRTQILHDVFDVGGDERRQQESVVQPGAPADQRGTVGLAPEAGDERADEQRLHQRHLRVRRHLEPAQLEQAEPAARGVGAVQLVDAELGAVGVAGEVGEQVPQRAVDHPWPGAAVGVGEPFELGERDLELVQRSRAGPRRPAAPGWSGR